MDCNAPTLKGILSGLQQVVERQLTAVSALENEHGDVALENEHGDAHEFENGAVASDELNTSFSSSDADKDPFREEYDDQDKSFLPSGDESNDSSYTSDSGIVNMGFRQNSENNFDGAYNNAQNQINGQNQIGEASTSGATNNAIEHSDGAYNNAYNQLNGPNRIGEASTSGAANKANKQSKKSNQNDGAFNAADKQSEEFNKNDIGSTNARPVKEAVVWKSEPTKIFFG